MLLHNKKGPWGPHDAFASDKRDRSRCCLTLRQFRFHRLLGWMDAAQIPSICTPPPIVRTRQSRTGSHWPGPIGDYSSQRNDYLLSNQQRRRSSFFNHTTYAIGSPYSLLDYRLRCAGPISMFFSVSAPQCRNSIQTINEKYLFQLSLRTAAKRGLPYLSRTTYIFS